MNKSTAQEKIRKNLFDARLAFDNMPFALWWKDLELKYAWSNQRSVELLMLNNHENFLELNDFEMPWERYAKIYTDEDRRIIDNNVPSKTLHPIVLGNNHDAFVLVCKSPYYDENANILGITGYVRTLSNKSSWQTLNHISRRDQGLFDGGISTHQEYIVSDKYTQYNLTKRESECLFYTLRGQTAKEIAKIYKKSYRTVETQLDNIKMKVGVNSKRELVRKVIEDGFINIIPESILL